MSKLDITSKLHWKLFEVMRIMHKAKVANDALYNSYFGQENLKCIITKYYDASDLHSIVEDYIDKACKELENILNDWKKGNNMSKRKKIPLQPTKQKRGVKYQSLTV